MGEKKSSHAITEEYAKADPVYVEKTRVSIACPEEGERCADAFDRGYHRLTAISAPYREMGTVDGEVCQLLSKSISSLPISPSNILEHLVSELDANTPQQSASPTSNA